ncbi:Chitin synthase regulatory factor 4 [Exophiala dermatitidis]
MSYNTAATFVPGGDDSYYMPELIQPTPNRIHELPTNIEQNVAQMEKAASNPPPISPSVYSPQSAEYMHQGTSWPSMQQVANNEFAQGQTAPNNSQTQPYQQVPYHQKTSPVPQREQPNFSPFPILRNPPPNIPPTDEQKEATLEAARLAVLACNDPETQLTWAQDALSYVEVCQQNEERAALAQAPRPRTPRVEHALREDALKIVNFLADQHHPKAEFMRGMWLEFGKFGHRIDKREAFNCYSRASEKGYVRADYRIGMQFESSNDALKAIKYYQKGADAGDSAACYRLGMMTLLGQHGQAQDYERGLNLIYASAQTADENAPQGAYVFGMLQAHQMPQIQIPESYLPIDMAAAKTNIEKAAYLGFAKAQVKMGAAYELCELGCPFDPALSLHYNALAARQGEPDAEMAISKWFLCGHEGLFDKNEEMAFTYAQRAALSGLATAQFALGYFYEVGIYVPVNFEQAKEWYRKASQGGNQDAGGRIEAISRSKTLSRKDHEKIALSKIRQQRGSIIGGVQAPPLPPMPTLPTLPTLPAMPTVSEEHNPSIIDMPDPARLSLNPQRPPTTRPGSAAPYPTDNTGMPTATHASEFRPTSAFGINPNLRPASVATVGVPRPDPYGQPHTSPQQRPHSTSDSRIPSGSYSQGTRIPSGRQPGPGGPQVRPPQKASGTSSPYLDPRAASLPPTPPMLDIGFSAPVEERKPRPQQVNGPTTMGKPQPPTPNNLSRPASRPNVPSQQQNYPQTRPPPPTNSRPGPGPGYGGPPSTTHTPPNRTPMPPAQQTANRPTANNTPISSGAAQPPSKPASMPATAARPPGKGPKTFDEMGVPPGKDKSECTLTFAPQIVM